ncbi:Ribosomal protein L35 [Perilla frutescens var. hirtella]|nr:Ribosomal protein L35 [Perilla frutescens var. frutescens]KAH6794428.1 Ribosomal protein L35 [Perilla frutescens var. hirtella]
MATATMAAMFSFRLTTLAPPHKAIQSATVPSTPLIKKHTLSLNFSSSLSICGLRPLVLTQTFDISTPIRSNPQPLTVVSAKGYKMKTHKASAKRFRVSGSGKIMRRRAGKQHLLRKKNTKRKTRLSKMVQVDRSDYNNVIGALPYLKVNRSN